MNAFLSAIFLTTIGSMAQAAEIVVFAPGNVREAISQIIPRVEASTGEKVRLVLASNIAMREKLEAGEPFDVLINNSGAMTNYKQARFVIDARLFSRVFAGLVYRKGSPVPDVTTPESFKSFIQGARTISHSDFRFGGGSAAYYQAVITALGIFEIAESKAVLTESGQGAIPVNDGRAEVGIAQSSEITGLQNVAITRLLPSDPKGLTMFEIALSSKARNAKGAMALVEALTTEDARTSYAKWGFVP